MKRLVVRVALGVAAGIAVYIGLSIWADVGSVGEAMASFHGSAAVIACGLAAANYLVRFVRWEYYLRVLGIRVGRADSALVFFAGFALTVTPGKLGEAVKAFLLRASHQVPVARTAPIVIAERVTDLLALLLLTLVGVFTFDVDRRFLAVGAVLVGAGILVVSVDRVADLAIALAARVPGLRRYAPRLGELHRNTAALLHPGPLLVATLFSLAAWFLECIAVWVIVRGFEGATISLRAATFVYATTTVAGALSFVPGGLGVTEAGMLTLLPRLAVDVSRGTAAAATFVIRACTLWFAVALGLPALLAYARRKHVAVDTVAVELDRSGPPIR